jgi:hypothetical protein
MIRLIDDSTNNTGTTTNQNHSIGKTYKQEGMRRTTT